MGRADAEYPGGDSDVWGNLLAVGLKFLRRWDCSHSSAREFYGGRCRLAACCHLLMCVCVGAVISIEGVGERS